MLDVPADDAKVLVFSFVGMVSQEVVIGTKLTFSILLRQEAISA